MDCLLVKKGQEIRDLEKKLEQSLARVNSVVHDSKIEDFDMDITLEKTDEVEALNSQPPDINDHIEVYPFKRPELEKDSNGYYNCSECNHKTKNSGNIEVHYRGHTGEKPFGCKLCKKRFTSKHACLQHIRGHDDRYKLKCSICDAKFMDSKTILRHVERLHNGKGYERKKRLIKRKRESP